MFDAEYNDQIRSFVESVEPDLSYEGSDGLLSMVIESAENMMTINSFVEAEDKKEEDKENFLVRGAKTVGGWIKKAFEALVRLIKKLIEKIKGLFMNLFHKLKTLYAQAVKKIGEFVKKGVNFSDKNRATCKWFVMTKALPLFDNKVTCDYITKRAQGSVDNNEWVEKRTKNSTMLAMCIKGMGPSEGEIETKGYSKALKDYCFTEKEGNIAEKDFDKIYKTDISELNKAYKTALANEADMLKAIDKAESELKDKDAQKDRFTAISKVTHAQTAAMSTWMSSVFSLSIFGFHQALKALMVGIKGTIAAKARGGADYAGTKLHQVARKLDSDEPIHNSVDIDDLGLEIL